MKKNRTLRVSALLLALTLITTCFVGGTFAKYITSDDATTTARVANWGFKSTSMTLNGLFSTDYTNVKSNDADLVVAPGTTGQKEFAFHYDDANGAKPEVAYTFTVDTTDSAIDNGLKAELLWSLDDEDYDLTWDQLLTEIKTLSGDNTGTKQYAAGELPAAFANDTTNHTIYWKWIFEDGADEQEKATSNAADTALGNAATLDEVTLKITITAAQVD